MIEKEIIETICFHFNVSLFDIFSKKRNSKFVITRMFIYFYFYKELKYNYSNIAKIFSYDHATIINGIKNIENICNYDDSYKQKVNEIFFIFNKEPFFKEVLNVEFYRNFIKKLLQEDALSFFKLNICKKDKNKIFKDLKLTKEEIEKYKKYEWKEHK